MLKKLLALLLILPAIAAIAAFPISNARVSAEGTGFVFNGITLTITGTGPMPNYKSSNETPWYSNRNDIREIVISSGVTSIGNNAFAGTTVMDVTIPDTVTSIGDYAFSDCKYLEPVVMPNSVTKIGIYAFSSCTSLKNLTLSNKLEAIPEGAFIKCSSIEGLTIPGSVKSIGARAFVNCKKLEVTFSEGLETIGESAFTKETAVSPVGYANKTLRIPDSVTSIGKNAFADSGSLTTLITGANLTDIGNEAFINCSKLETVDLSRSQKLDSIGESSFCRAGVKSIVIPDSVTTIKSNAFDGCSKLTYVKLPKNLKEISYQCFQSTALEQVEIPENVTTIGRDAFRSTQIKKIVIPFNVTKIYPNAFGTNNPWNSPLAAVDISNKYLVLEYSAFSGTSLTHVHIPGDRDVSYFAGKYGLPSDESCFFKIGADGKCPAAVCPFREGDTAVGDVDGSGAIDLADVILLGRSFMSDNPNEYASIADMDGDGKITLADVILLGRQFMGQ